MKSKKEREEAFHLAHPEKKKEYSAKYYKSNKEKVADANKNWRLKNPGWEAEYRRQYRDKNRAKLNERRRIARASPASKAKARAKQLYKLYGITIDQYEQLLASQGGVCAICLGSLVCKQTSKGHVDHCHKTGKIRGILCNRCNRGIGYFRDNPTITLAATNYLIRHQE